MRWSRLAVIEAMNGYPKRSWEIWRPRYFVASLSVVPSLIEFVAKHRSHPVRINTRGRLSIDKLNLSRRRREKASFAQLRCFK